VLWWYPQGFAVDFMWKSTSFDRMQVSIVNFAEFRLGREMTLSSVELFRAGTVHRENHCGDLSGDFEKL